MYNTARVLRSRRTEEYQREGPVADGVGVAGHRLRGEEDLLHAVEDDQGAEGEGRGHVGGKPEKKTVG
jgi:hypothetical protein